jgi:hypothetical protein
LKSKNNRVWAAVSKSYKLAIEQVVLPLQILIKKHSDLVKRFFRFWRVDISVKLRV